jgi:hypothetical protein
VIGPSLVDLDIECYIGIAWLLALNHYHTRVSAFNNIASG